MTRLTAPIGLNQRRDVGLDSPRELTRCTLSDVPPPPRCSSCWAGAPLDELSEDPGTAVPLDCGDILELPDVLLEDDLK